MEKTIKRILREITETHYLYWRLPRKLINELGIDLYDENDVAYLNEIHFDTRNILVELYTHVNGELEWYDGITNVPSTFEGVYTFPLDELPRSVKDFISRRLDPKYMKYIITESKYNFLRRRYHDVEDILNTFDRLMVEISPCDFYLSDDELGLYDFFNEIKNAVIDFKLIKLGYEDDDLNAEGIKLLDDMERYIFDERFEKTKEYYDEKIKNC
jgi:hypothetical protein